MGPPGDEMQALWIAARSYGNSWSHWDGSATGIARILLPVATDSPSHTKDGCEHAAFISCYKRFYLPTTHHQSMRNHTIVPTQWYYATLNRVKLLPLPRLFPPRGKYFRDKCNRELFLIRPHQKKSFWEVVRFTCEVFFKISWGCCPRKYSDVMGLTMALHLSLRIYYSGPSLPRKCEHLWSVNPRYTYN